MARKPQNCRHVRRWWIRLVGNILLRHRSIALGVQWALTFLLWAGTLEMVCKKCEKVQSVLFKLLNLF